MFHNKYSVLTVIMKYSDSRTFKDLYVHQIPKLSRPSLSVFKDFPGPGKIDNVFRTFKKMWTHWHIHIT